jgi:2-polyprenyl-3-methyl-5-hydroxy-6-metoxy-1,4-benzoquinol methylase
MHSQLTPLYKAATDPYAQAGRHAWHFARGKLKYDPAFFGLLKHGVLPDHGRLFDLGCGQGILLSVLLAARKQYAAGQWPQGWPAPPSQLTMHGIELREDCVHAAQQALGNNALVETGDIQTANLTQSAAVVLLDVLHYLDDEAQRRLLARIAASLEPGGVLLMRETDAGAGMTFQLTHWAERIAGFHRGLLRHKMCYRSTKEWVQLLEEFGFNVSLKPMSEGTPFSNFLFVAKKSAE